MFFINLESKHAVKIRFFSEIPFLSRIIRLQSEKEKDCKNITKQKPLSNTENKLIDTSKYGATISGKGMIY